LWERWFPDEPCFELLDDKMQAGYQLQAPGEAAAACTIWLGAWNDALRIFDKSGMQSIREFDERFKGTEFVCNWVQDLEHALWSAGLKDRQFLTARVAVCEEVLRRFHAEDDSSIDNRLRALAESYFELGETAKAEGLYRDWLNVDPRWGRGWIGWSDCYRFTRTEFRNWDGTEQILREGLAVAGVRDRADLIGRLLDLCEEQGRTEEAAEFRREAKRMATEKSRSVSLAGTVLRQKTKIDFGGEGLPLSDLSAVTAMLRGNSAPAIAGKSKVGRNDPCPCGSGKKFKKCCGAWRTWACASAYPPPGPEKAPVPPLRVPIDSAGY
jgi:tetratricopeptide (TPR) repeat protein